MPGKSRRKGKHLRQSRKAKAKLRQIAGVQPATPAAAAPPVVKPTPAPAPVTATAEMYQYVPGELKRIGVLAGITLVILIVLAIVLT